ncbi:MAG TPA: cytochrome b/b6 domain-containing protein [Anaerolineales bacterium]|nr:cytochrome b/b6 domain-containing protein [Anaerolineales bacterium]
MSEKTTRTYERFPLARRIEHIVMLLSFTTLGLTGLPQRYPDAGISTAILSLFSGIEGLRNVHHIAAIVMMLGTAWHILVFGYMAYVRRTRMSMLPSLQDAKDGLQALLYNIGLSKTFPQMGRYTFEEKMEYWAFVWGAIVMGATGFMMWNPISTAKFLPGEFIPAAKAAHGGEAVLAVLAIIIWHMYGVHIRRFNKSMFTGQLEEDAMLHEHPLELADIKAGIADPQVDPAILRKRQRLFFPVATVLTLFMLGGVYGFVNAEDTALETTERQIPTIEVYVPQTATPAPTQTPTSPPPEPASATEQPATAPTWNSSIGAMLQTKCSLCHGDAGGLNLETWMGALGGGNSGPVILPGDATNSLLVTVQQEGGHPGQLGSAEIDQIIEWINAGALEE